MSTATLKAGTKGATSTSLKRNIKKVAVLGSGVMGSGIACHLANIGLDVLLLDIVPRELNDAEKKAGLTMESKAVRNRIVNDSLQFALKSKPSPIYRKSFASRIAIGNMDDDMAKIKDCDWIIEVVIERLDIKQQVFEKVENYRKPGTLITSNTSGIPISQMAEGRSEDFKKHFCGTHFFNPPRYLQLFEIIPHKGTDPAVIDFFIDYGARFLGKTSVLAKDTPAFIGNRIGMFAIMSLFPIIEELDLTVEEIDKLTGPVSGKPKSATFRTCDVVGLDTFVNVNKGLDANLKGDEAHHLFTPPKAVTWLVENKFLGSKTKKGFYERKNENGKKVTYALDLKTLEYKPSAKVSFATLDAVKSIEDLSERMKALFNGKDKAGEFYRKSSSGLFQYCANKIPEISDELYRIDDGMRAGYGWKQGPFEIWDAVGVAEAVKVMESLNKKPAAWVYEMLSAGHTTFYKIENGLPTYYDIPSKSYKVIPGSEKLIALKNITEDGIIWKNAGTTIKDLGDGIINIEFHTKMNTIGAEVIEGLNKAVDLAEAQYKGLIISNDGDHFSAGANVGMIFMLAIEQEFDDLNLAVKMFQDTMMRLRYSSIPVIAAPHNMALGGGCEVCMHTDKVIAHAELYMGLVEMGVGVIPGGGGTKEFALRCSDELKEGDIRVNNLRNRFLTIGQAKVSTSAYEAMDLGYLRPGVDEIIVSRAHQLAYAKQTALLMAEKGYSAPPARTDITVLGKEGTGIVYVGADSMVKGNYMSEHDQLISEKLGVALCGGELTGVQQVSEQYLLDVERAAFVSLCGERKTLERMESLVKTGKILRN